MINKELCEPLSLFVKYPPAGEAGLLRKVTQRSAEFHREKNTIVI